MSDPRSQNPNDPETPADAGEEEKSFTPSSELGPEPAAAPPGTEAPAPEAAPETPPEAPGDDGDPYAEAAAEETAQETARDAARDAAQDTGVTADLEAQVADLNDKLLRALAEAENTRRRAQRDKEDATRYAITNFAREMLASRKSAIPA